MNVLEVDSGREWRGGQNQVRLLCRELRREPGLEVALVTHRESELARRAGADGVPTRGVVWTAGLDPRAVWTVRGALRELAPAIIHAHDSHALAVALAARWLVPGARQERGRPRIVATRRVDFPVGRWSAWHRADHIVAISGAVRDVLAAAGIQASRVTLVPSGVDSEEVRRAAEYPLEIRRRLGLPAEAPIAANVAALVGHKDHRTLLRAAAAAAPDRPDLHWVIAGEGDLRRALEAEAAALGVDRRVHFLGRLEHADALIREANVFVMSSRQEGLGSVVLHALVLGTPVVATAGGGLPEIVPREALAPVGDAGALARKTLAALGSRGPGRLPERYTAAAMAKAVVALYHALS